MKAAAWLLAVAAAVSAGPAVAEEPDAVWSPVESPTTDDLHIVRFWPDGTGWAFGENGATLRYDGTSWKQIPGPDPEAILHFAALAGPDEAWAAESGNNRLYHYARGQWSTVHLGAEMQTGGLDFLGPELGYAVGLFGVAYRYSNGRWERIQAPALASDRESHLTGVVILAPDDVWFGSSGDFVVHFDGREWRRLRPRGSEARGWFATRFGDTVALGGVPTLVRRGEAWEVIAPRTLFSVATGAGDTWGVAEGTSLVRVAPGEAVPAAPGRWIAAVAMGPHGSWAVGLHGTILRLERRRLPAFVDRTFEAGVGALAPSRAAALADLDGDGHPDLVLDSPFGRNSFLRNDGAGRFRVQPLVGLDASALSGGDAVAADLDGDGRVDLLVRPPGRPGQRPLRFYRNLGGWRFVDSSPAAAPLPAEDASDLGAVAVADLDGDGSLDAYEARFLNTPAGRPIPNVLWRNDGLGRFTQARLSHRDGGAALAWARGALLSDLDGDGRADVLSVNMWGQGHMLFLQGAGGALVDATAAS
ncbi:MAG TPA: VCBS repeat-containing protein, partial [Myxococcales bacterium]|nr:VCBS repeat-containing protein [Myxococcales bacterium]